MNDKERIQLLKAKIKRKDSEINRLKVELKELERKSKAFEELSLYIKRRKIRQSDTYLREGETINKDNGKNVSVSYREDIEMPSTPNFKGHHKKNKRDI